MVGFVPFRNICAIFNCITFKLISCFNSTTSYTRKTLVAIAVRTHEVKEELDEEKGNIFFEKDHQDKIEKFKILIF